jgi:hypothetical protein
VKEHLLSVSKSDGTYVVPDAPPSNTNTIGLPAEPAPSVEKIASISAADVDPAVGQLGEALYLHVPLILDAKYVSPHAGPAANNMAIMIISFFILPPTLLDFPVYKLIVHHRQ